MGVTERYLRIAEAALFLLAARLFGLRQLRWRFRNGDAIAIAKAMESAVRHLPLRTTCLDRSRALYSMLRAHGCPAELRIGAHREDGTLTAHAWVEHDGVPLLDDEAERFTVLRGASKPPGLPAS
jgi:hypothetical protein